MAVGHRKRDSWFGVRDDADGSLDGIASVESEVLGGALSSVMALAQTLVGTPASNRACRQTASRGNASRGARRALAAWRRRDPSMRTASGEVTATRILVNIASISFGFGPAAPAESSSSAHHRRCSRPRHRRGLDGQACTRYQSGCSRWSASCSARTHATNAGRTRR
jgi:hypothetical protein